jgi:hypothetical protein
LAVAQAATGICSDRQFLGVIDRLLAGWFAYLPDQSRYNRRLRRLRLAPWTATVQLRIGMLIDILSGRPPRVLAAYDGR